MKLLKVKVCAKAFARLGSGRSRFMNEVECFVRSEADVVVVGTGACRKGARQKRSRRPQCVKGFESKRKRVRGIKEGE